MLDYSGFAPDVRGLGPGKRVALWVRGCDIGCPGCMTKELWPKGEPRPIEPLAEEMLPHLKACDGLSITGGEPFDQAPALVRLIDVLRREIDVHVLSYSGYRLARLRKLPDCVQLLDRLDMLIDSPYVEGQANTKKWRGSDNQRLYLLSPRAKAADVGDEAMPEDRELQLQPLEDGRVRLIGIPRRGDLARLTAALEAKGMRLGAEG